MEFKKTDILDKVKAFLPKIAEANRDLAEKADELCIETPVDEETYDGRVIEMSFALVKADGEHTNNSDDSDDDSSDDDDDDNNSTTNIQNEIVKDINKREQKSIGKNRELIQTIGDDKNESIAEVNES